MCVMAWEKVVRHHTKLNLLRAVFVPSYIWGGVTYTVHAQHTQIQGGDLMKKCILSVRLCTFIVAACRSPAVNSFITTECGWKHWNRLNQPWQRRRRRRRGRGRGRKERMRTRSFGLVGFVHLPNLCKSTLHTLYTSVTDYECLIINSHPFSKHYNPF